MAKKREKSSSSAGHKLLSVIGVVLCIILIPILITNCLLIIRSYTHPDEVPSVGGTMPLIVLTDSMYPEIHGGDLIICHAEDAETIQEGDIIAFFDPAGDGTSVVTHRVVDVTEKDGGLAFQTQGDANNAPDTELVPADKLIGVYQRRIAGAGNVAMFMQTTQGMVVCVILPIILLIGYDIIRRRMYERAQKKDTDALMKELEELKKSKAKAKKKKKTPEK